MERGAELAELLPCMSAARFQGAGSPASNKKQALAKPPPAPAPVEVLSFPPDPILTLNIPYPHDSNKALCAVAKSCLHGNGWGAWQYNPASRTWTNLHKDSLPHEPRLNGSITELLQATATKFSESPICSAITFKSAGTPVPVNDLMAVEWTPIESLAAPPPDPEPEPASSTEVQAMEARLLDLEHRVSLLEGIPSAAATSFAPS